MPSRSELPGNLNRRKFTKALKRLGFAISTRGGDGSHYKVTWTNQKSITIQSDLRKDVLCYVLKQIKEISGVTWQEIKDKL